MLTHSHVPCLQTASKRERRSVLDAKKYSRRSKVSHLLCHFIVEGGTNLSQVTFSLCLFLLFCSVGSVAASAISLRASCTPPIGRHPQTPPPCPPLTLNAHWPEPPVHCCWSHVSSWSGGTGQSCFSYGGCGRHNSWPLAEHLWLSPQIWQSTEGNLLRERGGTWQIWKRLVIELQYTKGRLSTMMQVSCQWTVTIMSYNTCSVLGKGLDVVTEDCSQQQYEMWRSDSVCDQSVIFTCRFTLLSLVLRKTNISC